MPKQLPNYTETNLESLRPFSQIQLIVLDLDGTLLDSSESRLPERVRKLASSLQHWRYGTGRITVATGRTLAGARSLLDELPIRENIPIVLYNGSIVLNKRYDVLHRTVIPTSIVQRIIELAYKFKVKIIAYSCDIFGADGPTENAVGWSSLDMPNFDYNRMRVTWQSWNNVDDYLTPSTIVIYAAGNAETISQISLELNKVNDITYTHGGNDYIEVRPKDSNKGVALQFVAKELNLNRSQVLALGDNDNDAEMLSWAGIGVAVDSASKIAKANSDYIANQGVIDGAIEVMNLIRRARKLFFPSTKYSGRIKKISTAISDANITNNEDTVKSDSLFIDERNVIDFCHNSFGYVLDRSALKFMIDHGLLSVFKYENQKMILKSDLTSLINGLNISKDKVDANPQCEQFIVGDVINIYPDTHIDLIHEDTLTIPTFFSACPNLICEHRNLLTQENKKEMSIPYFSSTRLSSFSVHIIEYAKKQLYREKMVDVNTISQFARSAYYMGSKRSLCGFIVEGISSVLPEYGVVVDLMCGSGVASGAFSRIWKTYSSDAQEFCRILAVIHGGGFNSKVAKNLISKISPIFKRHFDDLNLNLSDILKQEEKIFCSDMNELLLQEYKDFIQGFPTLSNIANTIKWNPEKEVTKRKEHHSLYPYCLFTLYFANKYFGVRQSVEIDSLRYAIDQLQDDNEKHWALGALIATISALGTTAYGHFAQPRIRGYENLDIKNITSVVDKRSPSIIHEFAVRLLNLAEQSQNVCRRIESVPGPWNNALNILSDVIIQQPVLVYLDAPYTREEYSRYYHVLETLVTYSYPSCTGIGLTPKPNERFQSEFFTKVECKVSAALVNVITNILQRNWMCAWSYSDSGVANIYQVIDSVHQKTNCYVKSYSAPYTHKSQGPRKHKTVTENLIIFTPMRLSVL